MRKIGLVVATVSILFACGSDNAKNSTEETTPSIETPEVCHYTYSQDSPAKITWTAYKTSEKVGVPGSFNEIMVTSKESYTKISDLITNVKFSIPVTGTNTNNEDRDNKIIASFFGTMEETETITGSFVNVVGDDKGGTCDALVVLNKVEHKIVMDYAFNEGMLNLKGVMDLNNWEALPAVEALNKVCEDLHKGADGVSVTWPEVSIEIATVITKECH